MFFYTRLTDMLKPNMAFTYSMLAPAELEVLQGLRTPQKIQDFLDSFTYNFETDGETCLSPRRVLRERRAHCIEGAMLAGLALRLQGDRPLLLDLISAPHDYDHVIALFKRHGHWGAISKTNHSVLRYRDPIYKTIRELVLSYFHEYTDDDGKKTLRSYSQPVDLSRLDHLDWMTSEENLWDIAHALNRARHYPLLSRQQLHNLRHQHPLEQKASQLTEWVAATPQ